MKRNRVHLVWRLLWTTWSLVIRYKSELLVSINYSHFRPVTIYKHQFILQTSCHRFTFYHTKFINYQCSAYIWDTAYFTFNNNQSIKYFETRFSLLKQ